MHIMQISALWVLTLLSVTVRVRGDHQVTIVDDQQLIEAKVRELVEVNTVSIETLKKAAKTAMGSSSVACVAGGMFGFLFMGPGGAALACKLSAAMQVSLSAMDSLNRHWNEKLRRGHQVWKLYVWSYTALDSAPWEDAGSKYRRCAIEHHPDKLPKDLGNDEREWHLGKLANCKFANAYIKMFRSKWGETLQAHRSDDARIFLQSYAGVWASSFGTNPDVSEQELDEVIEELKKRRTDL